MILEEAAPAKVNLFLHVTGRRADGYHLLDSLAVFAGAADRLRARPDAGWELRVAGPQAAALADAGDNLVLRAGAALAAAAGVTARGALVLEKHLPVASGIGGGSADAAAALRLLIRLWGVTLPAATLHAVARGLGADVPVCLNCRPARMSGVGEVLLTPPALPGFGLVLVNPGVAVATPAVFRARAGEFRAAPALPRGWASAAEMAMDLAACGNDLEPAACALCPQIVPVLAALRALPDCLLARMSGSGATCFGLFADPAAAAAAAARLGRAAAGWWVWGGAPRVGLAADLAAEPAATY